jgi:hypothetical protein
LPFKANPGPGNNRDDHAALAHTVEVPDPAGVGGGFTPNVLPGTGSVDIPVGGIPSTDSQPLNTACRLEAIGSCLDSRGSPPEVIELLLSATRKNTNAAYQSSWNNLNNWCDARNVHPMSGGVKEVLCYLAGIFGAGMSYSSINVSRSMLSSTHNINREEIVKHPVVTRLKKGIFQARPPTPKSLCCAVLCCAVLWWKNFFLFLFHKHHMSMAMSNKSCSGYDKKPPSGCVDLRFYTE